MDYKLKAIILFFTIITYHQSDASTPQEQLLADFQNDMKPFVKTMVEKNTLNYDDSCDYSVEQERTKLGKNLLNLVSSIDIRNFNFQDYKNKFLRIVRSLSELRGPLCITYQNLQCNSNGTCACAEADESLGFPVRFTREDDRCVLAGGSLCMPADAMEQARQTNPLLSSAPKQDLSCAKSAVCIVRNDRSTCSLDKYKDEFRRLAENNPEAARSDPIGFVLRKTKEGVCVCKGANAILSTTIIWISALFWAIKYFF